jgi:hypothetical protein
MKKIITSIVIVTLVTMFLQACKKSDTTTTLPQTTLQKIQAKWTLESIVENNYYSGSNHTNTTTGTSTDYLDFKTDGKVYYSISGFTDVVTYSLINDTRILIDGTETYEIKTLTANSFVLYQKTIRNATDYDEETIIMKR